MGKKYSVEMKDGELVSVEVDGVRYNDPGEIPNDRDRLKVEEMAARMEMDAPVSDSSFDSAFDREFEADIQEPRRQSVVMPKVLTAIFGGVAALMLIIAAISTVSTINSLSQEQSAPGQVVEVTRRTVRDSETGDVSEYFYPVVKFTPAGRPARTVQLGEGSWPPAYVVGDEVTIRYNPERPNDARIQSGSSMVTMWIWPGVTLILGIAFAGAAFMVFKVFWPKPGVIE